MLASKDSATVDLGGRMAEHTGIEWTDVTDNIIVVKGGGWWCRRLSPGCTNCYAAKLNQNGFYGGNHLSYGGAPPELVLREDIIERWRRQTKPRRHFVASMTDVFGEWVPQHWIFRFLDAMRSAPLQTFQVLSKRSDVMRSQVAAWLIARDLEAVPLNIWLGASVEDQERADQRIPELLETAAKVRFLSIEPLLGMIDLSPFLLRGVRWVIVGGESGTKARPMNPKWATALRDQCVEAGIPFFFKQWGEWGPDALLANIQLDENSDERASEPSKQSAFCGDDVVFRIGKKAAGRLLDGHVWSQFPDQR